MTPAQMAQIHAQVFTLPRPWSQAEFTAILNSGGIEHLSHSQGFLLGRIVAGEAEILTLAVAQGHWRQGLGQHLVTAFLTRCRERQASAVFLEVAAGNLPAQQLYAKLGFLVAGRRKNYFSAPGGAAEDALVMVFRQ